MHRRRLRNLDISVYSKALTQFPNPPITPNKKDNRKRPKSIATAKSRFSPILAIRKKLQLFTNRIPPNSRLTH